MLKDNWLDVLDERFHKIFNEVYRGLPTLAAMQALDRRQIVRWKFKYGWLP